MKTVHIGFLVLASLLFLQGCAPEGFESGFLAAWSPDGSKAAVVPNLLDDDEKESGIWLLEAESGRTRHIFQAEEGSYCVHPRWSPWDAELLFGLVDMREEDSENDEDPLISIWKIGEDGSGLIKLAETRLLEDSALWPNRIAWGPMPGTIIVEEPTVSGRSTAVLVDLPTGTTQPFLPGDASAWMWEFSPSREAAAALLFDNGFAEVWVGDARLNHWRTLGRIRSDHKAGGRVPLISWSPDSESFVVLELEPRIRPTESDRHWLRLFDALSGDSRRIAEGKPDGPVCWAPRGTSFAFAGDGPAKQAGIFLVDPVSGTQYCALPGEGLRVFAWHREGRDIISYFQAGKSGHSKASSGDGMPGVRDAHGGRDLIAAKLIEDDMGWSVSPDGGHAVLFGQSLPVLVLDLPYGIGRHLLALTAHQAYDAAQSR